MRTFIDIVEYQEEKGSTFSHDGIEYDVNAIFDIENDLPLYEIDVNDLSWVLEYDTPDRNRVRAADDSVPILITIWEKKLTVLDGLHRLARAIKDDLSTLPAYFIPPCMLPRFVYGKVGEDRPPCELDATLYQVDDEWFYDYDTRGKDAEILDHE
jgi:hypothetical protein